MNHSAAPCIPGTAHRVSTMFGVPFVGNRFRIASQIIRVSLSGQPGQAGQPGQRGQATLPAASMPQSLEHLSARAYVGTIDSTAALQVAAARIDHVDRACPALARDLIEAAGRELLAHGPVGQGTSAAIAHRLRLNFAGMRTLQDMAVIGPGADRVARGHACADIASDLGIRGIAARYTLEKMVVNARGPARLASGQPCREIERDLGLTCAGATLALERMAVEAHGKDRIMRGVPCWTIQHELGLTSTLAIGELEMLAVMLRARELAGDGMNRDDIRRALGLTQGWPLAEVHDIVARMRD